MIRKTTIAVAATVTIAAAALVPTAASAKGGFHHGHHGFGGFGFGITVVDRAYADCGYQWVKVGRNMFKRIYVCN